MRKNFGMKGVLAALVCGLAVQAFAAELVGKVTRVTDGDSLWVTDSDGVRTEVRLSAIDAPEYDQPYGQNAVLALKRLVDGKKVLVSYDNQDQYGRVVGTVMVDGQDVNLEMIRNGHAWHYSHFDQTPAYAEAQAEAQKARRGLWKDAAPVNPYEWRKGKRKSGKQSNN